MTVATRPAPARTRPATPPSAAASLRAAIAGGLREHARTAAAWGVPLGAMSALMALLWPSIEDSIGRLLSSYPERLKAAFNIDTITSVETYVDAEMLSLVVPLVVGLLAARLVAVGVAGAEEDGRLDVLLATPLARRTLVASALATTAIVVAQVLAITVVMTWVAGLLVGADPSLAVLARGFGNVWPIAIFVAGVAALAAGLLRGAGRATGIAAGTLVAMYVLDLVGKLTPDGDPLRTASVFKYYGSAVRDGIDPLAFGGVTLAGLALGALGAAAFERRDVR